MVPIDNRKHLSKSELRIAIVSPYPPPGEKHIYGSGVISYTKSLAEALGTIASPNVRIFVIADKIVNARRIYRENAVYVIRCFPKNVLYIFQIFRQLCRIRPVIVHLQHEYFLYGGLLPSILFPFLVLLSRLIAKNVVVTLHHGIFPLNNLNDKDFRKENGLKGLPFLLKLGLLTITRMIALFAHKVVVHEPFMKKYLIADYKVPSYKIKVIPHGVEDVNPIPKEEAKKKLGLGGKTVLLYFGYLTGYKGIRELLDAYKKITKNIPNTVLIIAGGPHPRLAKERWYRDWIRSIVKKALNIQREIKGKGKIMFTGYLPEAKIPLYFSATDIVVLPYKARIAASGPEALAIAYGRPVIITKVGVSTVNYSTELTNCIIRTLTCEGNVQRIVAKLRLLRTWINVAWMTLREVYCDTGDVC